MTKDLGNRRYVPAQQNRDTLFARIAPALFPLAAAVLGYFVGRHFFGF